MEIGSTEYISRCTDKQLKADIRHYLSAYMTSSGSIRMTIGDSSELTEFFTNVLEACHAFKNGTPFTWRQLECCRYALGCGWTYTKTGRKLKCDHRTVSREINRVLGSLAKTIRANVN